MPASQLHVAIVGAGLGALAAAIGIAKSGYKATILEQASALGEVCIDNFYTNHVLTT
jgi:salicylate hydroxylase